MPARAALAGVGARSGAGRLAILWIGGYIGLSLPVLVAGGHGSLALLHVALLGLLGWSLLSSSRLAKVVGDLAPIVLATALAYDEVPVIVATLGSSYRDLLVQRWELLLFGSQPSHVLAGRFPYAALSELLHGGYMAFYLATFVPPLLLYVERERDGFDETVLTLTITWTTCCAFYAFFPVQGPRYLWGAPVGVPDGPLRRMATAILAAGSARGAAFPSLHMAASVSQTVMAWRWQRRWIAYVVTGISALVAAGAVYAGFHYAIDMIVGGAWGLVIVLAVRRSRQ